LSACSRPGHVLSDPAAENLLCKIVESRGLHCLPGFARPALSDSRSVPRTRRSEPDGSLPFFRPCSLVTVKKRPPRNRPVLILPTSCLMAKREQPSFPVSRSVPINFASVDTAPSWPRSCLTTAHPGWHQSVNVSCLSLLAIYKLVTYKQSVNQSSIRR
jgi:hypothetical protein